MVGSRATVRISPKGTLASTRDSFATLPCGDTLDTSWKVSDLVADYLLRSEIRGFSPNTVKLYSDDLTPFLRLLEGHGATTIGRVGVQHVEGFLRDAKNRGCSPHSVNRLYRNLRAFFSDIVRRHEDYSSPLSRIPVPKIPTLPPKATDIEDVQKMISACRGPSRLARRDATFIRLLFDSGLRLSEAVSLQRADMDFNSGTLVVRGKGGQTRAVMLSHRTLLELRRYVRDLPTDCAFLFPDKTKKCPIDSRWMRERIKRLGRRVNVLVTPHRLRHGCARFMLMEGADVHTVAARLGHRTSEMALHYSRLFCKDTLERGKRFSPGDRL